MQAIFLDKDGTLIEDIPYNVDPDKIHLSEGAVEGLQLLYRAGYPLIVVSNQAGIAHGYFSEKDLEQVVHRLEDLLAEIGVLLAGFYYCPHHPEGKIAIYRMDCDCRKPAPGLLFQAALEQGIDLKESWMIGDILNDIEAGQRAGCHTILINNGNETEWVLNSIRMPQYCVLNLTEAAHIILAQSILKTATS
uniref:D,D-heptose 1,7-bisphosphate phosphatase n=1 Tax=Cyanothece sp. (strain PCC 7425 / ATCC 29141) TaxID=395961 RepID=B8HSR5_CYAP4